MRSVTLALLLCVPTVSNAWVTSSTFDRLCNTPNQTCYGFLLGLFEAEGLYQTRIDELAKEQDIKLPLILIAQKNYCFPASYDRAAKSSLDTFLEKVRLDLYPLVRAKVREQGHTVITNPAGNILANAMRELYSCSLPRRSAGDFVW